MKKILKFNKKNQNYINSLKSIYLVCKWANYGFRKFPYAKTNKEGIPLVYEYDDHNGTTDNYYLRKITNTTTGIIYFWTFSESVAQKLSNALNFSEGHIIK